MYLGELSIVRSLHTQVKVTLQYIQVFFLILGPEQLEVGPGYGSVSLSSREAESDFTSTSEPLDADELLKTHDHQISE